MGNDEDEDDQRTMALNLADLGILLPRVQAPKATSTPPQPTAQPAPTRDVVEEPPLPPELMRSEEAPAQADPSFTDALPMPVMPAAHVEAREAEPAPPAFVPPPASQDVEPAYDAHADVGDDDAFDDRTQALPMDRFTAKRPGTSSSSSLPAVNPIAQPSLSSSRTPEVTGSLPSPRLIERPLPSLGESNAALGNAATTSTSTAPFVSAAPDAPSESSVDNSGDAFNPADFDLPPEVKAALEAHSKAQVQVEALVEQAVTASGVRRAASGLFPEMNFRDVTGVQPVQDASSSMRSRLGQSDKAHGFENDPASSFFPDELEEAEFFIEQELYDEAREILHVISEDVPDSPRVQWMLARIEARATGTAEPLPPWEQAILDGVQEEIADLPPTPPAPTPELTGQVSMDAVLSQFRKGVSETVADDDAATHYDLGIAYREMGLDDDAIAEFTLAARSPVREADARYLIGLTRVDLGEHEEALASFTAALNAPTITREQRAANEYQRGVALEHLTRATEALVAFKNAKQHGSTAADLDRRIQQLNAMGRGKNIDYV
jgi:tetratricopeptide (TPR) repeat protein